MYTATIETREYTNNYIKHSTDINKAPGFWKRGAIEMSNYNYYQSETCPNVSPNIALVLGSPRPFMQPEKQVER